MNKIQVFLAGIGGYGANYLREFLDAKDPPFAFAGAADPFAENSSRYAELKERGIPVYKTPDEFFSAGGKADLTVIASPIHTHYPYIISCFKNRSHVLCEKPITGDLSRLDELIAQEKESGLFCAVGFQACFAPDTLELKKDILAGMFGKPVKFKSHNLTRRGDKYYSRNNWAGKLVVEGETILDSPLNNGCSHDLQLMFFLLGNELNGSAEITSAEIELWQGRPDIENFDASALSVTAAGGVPVLYYTAHCVEVMGGPMGEFQFEKAIIKRNENHDSGYTAYFSNGETKTYNEPDVFKKTGVSVKFHDCLESVKTKIPPVCTLKTVRSHLKCVDFAAKSHVIKVPKEKLESGTNEEGDKFYFIPGLSRAFYKGYEENVLPSKTGFKI